jgi:hypothetical protein
MRTIALAPDLVDRVECTYTCDMKHEFTRVFAADIEIPETWDCPHCGRIATQGFLPTPEIPRPTNKTHWEMIAERRTTQELNFMLSSRLEELRSGTGSYPFHP